MGWGLPGMPGTLGAAADTASVAKPTRLIIEDPSLTSSSSDDSLPLTTSGTSNSSAPSTSGKPNFKEPGSKFTEPGVGKDKAGPGDSDGPGSTDPGKGSGQGKTKGDDITDPFITSLTWDQDLPPFTNDFDALGPPAFDILRLDAFFSDPIINNSAIAVSDVSYTLYVNSVAKPLVYLTDYTGSLSPFGVDGLIEIYIINPILVNTGDIIRLAGTYGGTTVQTPDLSV